MIIGYQQLKRRKHAHSGDAGDERDHSQSNSAKNDTKEGEGRAADSANEHSPPSNQLQSPSNLKSSEAGRQNAPSVGENRN